MIFVTGDTHGLREDLVKLNTVNFPKSKELTKTDYVIICGDFGLVWNDSKGEKRWLQKLKDKKFTTLWIDGNHENFNLLEQYPVSEWKGGKVHFINDSVIHLMRGQIYEIEGLKFFTFGGAQSVDKYHRKENISWWKEEMPSKEEYEEGLKNFEKHKWTVDYIITHDCCSNLKDILLYKNAKRNELNKFFDLIETKVNYKHWFFGHYHEERTFQDNKHTVIYNDVIEIT
ncbi:metallophosphoesterase family protein [Clostridium grantii]|uniref:Calcineurin-like phosphoesterase n=1 Tax=Clostridium grantii DSM 8605 TaxID=1121316 RepID=A0A1M5R033_9CLOT|nr:metallophosphoesterase [Clostridium grantii]SHH19754.1 Calcineurin-like phosphoesterase [Clostridium grantii DSM 8605]